MEHITSSNELRLPHVFSNMGEFLEFATKSCKWTCDTVEKAETQQLYDFYFDLLKQQVTIIKSLIKQFIDSLGLHEHMSIMHVLNKLYV
jgi:hypothetical protein